MLTEHELHTLSTHPDFGGVAVAALQGDEAAHMAVSDAVEGEEVSMSQTNPFEVGETYLVETVTLYYVGRVKRIIGAFVEMENASWVHWTGRKSTLAKNKDFAHSNFPDDEQKPRTEYVGEYGFSLSSVVGYMRGPWVLPEESL